VGFTLAEIMIALGILGIGMAMVAAVFPAAMRFNEASRNSTLGTIICENAFVLAQLEIKRDYIDDRPSPTQLDIYADDVMTQYITAAQQHYPTGEDKSRTGFVLMARKLTADDDDYQFIAVAYRKSDADNTARLMPISCSVNGKNVTGATYLRVGSPLINRVTGEYAFIESVSTSGKDGALDRSLTGSAGTIGAFVLVEAQPMTGPPPQPLPLGNMRRSPAIGAMSKLTGLSADPNPDP